jgi:hypothetical protein
LTGIAGLGSKRLGAALGVGADMAGVAAVLAVHPLFLPRAYVDATVEADGDAVVLTVADGPSFAESDGLTWPALTVEHDDRAVGAAVHAVLPTAQIERLPVDAGGGVVAAWRITDDPTAEPARQRDEVTLAEFSTGANFHFNRHA